MKNDEPQLQGGNEAKPAPQQATTDERRALEWIAGMTRVPARFAGTPEERSVAETVGEWIRALGARDVKLEPVASAPKSGLVLGLHAAVGAFGLAWGGFLGALIAVLGAISFYSDFHRHQPILARLLNVVPSVNVLGRLGSVMPKRRVILSAHIDSAQAGLIFSRQLANRFASMARALPRPGDTPPGPLALPEGLLMTAAVLAVGGWLGAHGFLFGLARIVVVLMLVVTVAVAVQWALSPATPGANDNASAVAAMLLCAERLKAELPEDVELWVVGTGAEEVGCKGMRALLDEHAGWPPEHTFFVNFECVGGGALHYIRTEGVLQKGGYPPLMLELARRVAAGDFGEVTATDLLAATDGHVPAERGYPTLSLISLEPNGVPRNYHRLEDTVDGIDARMVVRAAEFGAAVTRAALAGEADPLRRSA